MSSLGGRTRDINRIAAKSELKRAAPVYGSTGSLQFRVQLQVAVSEDFCTNDDLADSQM